MMRIANKEKLGLIVLLGAVFFIPFFSAQNFSPATDEITHLPSGYSYWKTGQITLNPQHPPFVKLAASFPLLFMDLNFDREDPNLIGPFRNEWKFGSNFLFSNDADRLLMWGRLSVMLISVLLGLYIYKWASEMFNYKAGLIALFLYAFMPNIIAHSQFVTTDVALAAFSFITFYYLWKFFSADCVSPKTSAVAQGESPPDGRAGASGGKFKSKKYLVYSGLFLGLALSSKFSAVFFLPIIFLLISVYAKSGHPVRSSLAEVRRTRALGASETSNGIHSIISRFVKIIIIVIVPAFLVVYFSYLMPADSGFYLRALKTVYADFKPGFNFYLNGEFSQNSWWYYFLEAFLIKTPVPFLIAFAASILLYGKLNISRLDKVFIFLPMVFFALIASAKAHNIGIRYLIPAFPFMILYAGGGLAVLLEVSLATRSRVRRTLTGLLLTGLSGWYILSAVSVYPDYLAYFNELVGGPKNGYKYLDDSNIEWGHDLKRMGKYQIEYPETKVIYSWRNSSPEYYRINNFMMADDSGWWREPKGRYAINTFLLIRMQNLSETRDDPGLNWLALYEPADRIGQSFFIYEF